MSCVCVFQRNRLAWPHCRRGLASDGVRYAGARSSVGPRFRSATKLRLEWYGGDFLLLQQRSKHPREMVIAPEASTSLLFLPCPYPPRCFSSCSLPGLTLPHPLNTQYPYPARPDDDDCLPPRDLPTPGQHGHSPQRHSAAGTAAPTTADMKNTVPTAR